MCVICVKPKGVAFPELDTFERMWNHNPHGAGYMYARNGKVHIRKGFMDLYDLLKSIQLDDVKDDEVCVMHFRISTQAGISKEMTHPFPLCKDLEWTKVQSLNCDIGVAHNGIIQITSNPLEKEYSDTALFITQYMYYIFRNTKDVNNKALGNIVYKLAQSKFAVINGDGDYQLIGNFEEKNGCYFSNMYFEPSRFAFYERDRYGVYYNYKRKNR